MGPPLLSGLQLKLGKDASQGSDCDWEARKHVDRLAWIIASPLHTPWDLSLIHATHEQHRPLEGREHKMGRIEAHTSFVMPPKISFSVFSQVMNKQILDLSSRNTWAVTSR